MQGSGSDASLVEVDWFMVQGLGPLDGVCGFRFRIE